MKRINYIHLGKGSVINTGGIVGVFDLDITSQSHITRAYLAAAEKDGQIVNAAEDIPKSFVVTEENGQRRVYLSQLASATLLKRAESGKL